MAGLQVSRLLGHLGNLGSAAPIPGSLGPWAPNLATQALMLVIKQAGNKG